MGKKPKAIKSSKFSKDIRTLQAEKGSFDVALDESDCKNKLGIFLNSRVYEPLPTNPTARIQRRIQKL
jgi:hypothetical protein